VRHPGEQFIQIDWLGQIPVGVDLLRTLAAGR
jgi:hypothetical protein